MDMGMEQVAQDLAAVNRTAELLKVLAHPMRLCIVRGLLYEGSCNVTRMQECLHIPQSTISQHLAKLRAAGVIAGVRDGVEVHYAVVNPEAEQLIRALFS